MATSTKSFSIRDLCERYGVNAAKVCAWIKAGELKAVNVALRQSNRPRWRISPEALGEFEVARSARPTKRRKAPDAGQLPTEEVARGATEAIRELVFQFIKSRGAFGATDEEISAGTGLKRSTARARRVELRDAGRIGDSSRERPASSGRAAAVWVAMPARADVPAGDQLDGQAGRPADLVNGSPEVARAK